jgi:hypothetical protein
MTGNYRASSKEVEVYWLESTKGKRRVLDQDALKRRLLWLNCLRILELPAPMSRRHFNL